MLSSGLIHLTMAIYRKRAQGAVTKFSSQEITQMKKIMIASLGLSLLSGTAVFAQNTSTSTMSDTSSTKMSKKSKKGKKKGTDTMSSTTSTTK